MKHFAGGFGGWPSQPGADLGYVMLSYRTGFLAVLLLGLVSGTAPGKEWARKMFQTLEHDFGTVARGADAEFDFRLQNLYKEDIHISEVRSSCGCTTPTILKPTLKSWETGAIRAKLNSRSFLGYKKATITVVIDQPFPAEVQLVVHGFIRQDVVIQPGSAEFGELDAGSTAEQRLVVSYAGRPDWEIVDVQSSREYYKIQFRQLQRSEGRVDYEMLVQLTSDAPTGFLNDELVIISNDGSMQRIPFMAKGRVLSSISVSPASLSLGVLHPGQRVTKQLVVRSKKEFQVTDVHCDGDCLSFKSPSGRKKLHFIPVTFTAGDDPGELAMNITIQTDLGKGAIAQCRATASVRGD